MYIFHKNSSKFRNEILNYSNRYNENECRVYFKRCEKKNRKKYILIANINWNN